MKRVAEPKVKKVSREFLVIIDLIFMELKKEKVKNQTLVSCLPSLPPRVFPPLSQGFSFQLNLFWRTFLQLLYLSSFFFSFKHICWSGQVSLCIELASSHYKEIFLHILKVDYFLLWSCFQRLLVPETQSADKSQVHSSLP